MRGGGKPEAPRRYAVVRCGGAMPPWIWARSAGDRCYAVRLLLVLQIILACDAFASLWQWRHGGARGVQSPGGGRGNWPLCRSEYWVSRVIITMTIIIRLGLTTKKKSSLGLV